MCITPHLHPTRPLKQTRRGESLHEGWHQENKFKTQTSWGRTMMCSTYRIYILSTNVNNIRTNQNWKQLSRNKLYQGDLNAIVKIVIGTCCLGSFFGIICLKISLVIFRLDTFVRGPSLRSSRLISVLTFSLEVFRFGNFLVGSFVWELSLGVLRLIHSVWDVPLGSFRLGSFGNVVWGRPLWHFRLEAIAWYLSHGNFRVITFAWKLSFGILRLGAFDLTLSFRSVRFVTCA